MPKISIIVPVYKVEHYIRRCVDSILAQTFNDFELILIDDGSPDKSGSICDEYEEQDNRVCVIHQENKGQEAARNAGIDWAFSNSDSQWLIILDSDDWIHPQMVEMLYKGVNEQKTKLSICKYECKQDYEVPKSLEKSTISTLNSEQAFVDYYPLMTAVWGKCYSKELFETVRYPSGRVSGDSYVTYKLIFEAGRVAIVDADLYYYFNNPKGITNTSWSPRRMDAVVGREGQIAYFKNSKYKYALKVAVRGYVEVLMDYIDRMQKTEWAGSKYERKLRCKLGKTLIQYRAMYEFRVSQEEYGKAFPRMMRAYWHACAAKTKIKKMLK